ncbi:hypothetical protein ACWKWU_13430 [Chitinophaga lutea]
MQPRKHPPGTRGTGAPAQDPQGDEYINIDEAMDEVEQDEDDMEDDDEQDWQDDDDDAEEELPDETKDITV